MPDWIRQDTGGRVCTAAVVGGVELLVCKGLATNLWFYECWVGPEKVAGGIGDNIFEAQDDAVAAAVARLMANKSGTSGEERPAPEGGASLEC